MDDISIYKKVGDIAVNTRTVYILGRINRYQFYLESPETPFPCQSQTFLQK